MAGLIVFVIIIACITYCYLKSTLVNSFVMLISVICASFMAFGYFELLAEVFISRSENSQNQGVVPWAQMLSFLLLFIVAIGVLQAIVMQLLKHKIELDVLTHPSSCALSSL